MKKKLLLTLLSSVLFLSSFSQLTVLAAVTDGINAADAAAVIDEIRTLADDKEIFIDITALNNFSEITLERIARTIIDLRPEEGFADTDSVQEAYDTAVSENTAIIEHPMLGDIVLTEDIDEQYFNGIGNDTPAYGKLTAFALTDDIDVDSEYIASVKYSLANKNSSGMCVAASNKQDWSLYLVNGGFDEFGVAKDELEDMLTDKSMNLTVKNDKARAVNTFDITQKYKEYIDNMHEVFSIRTEIKDYQTIFLTGNKLTDNFITYIIDTSAIAEDLKNISDETALEEFVKKNGGAIGIMTDLYAKIPDKAALNKKILDAKANTFIINNEIVLEADKQSAGNVKLNRVDTMYLYTENSTAQGLPADFSSAGSGAVWNPQSSSSRIVFKFDLSEIPSKYIMSAMFNVTRNAGGPQASVIRKVSAAVASSDSEDFERLMFAPVRDKFYSKGGDNNDVDVTDYINGRYVFVGLNGYENDCFNNNATLTIKYNTSEIIGAFADASTSESNRILSDYGEMLGMTAEQLKQKAKVAIALAGVKIESTEEFFELVRDAIANVKQADILKAMNEAADIDEFEQMITELGASLGIEIELIDSLDEQRRSEIIKKMYNGGEDYETVSQFSERFYALTDEIYRELLSGLNTDDVDATKEFLLENGKLLGISDSDLKNNIDILALAFTNGNEIKTINEFKEIYSNYEEEAVKSIVAMINRSESFEEFDGLLKKYSSTLGISFTLYDKLSDKSGLYASVVGAADDKESFVKVFNEEISKYFAEPTIVYASQELMSNPKSDKPNTSVYEGWVGDLDSENHFIKYSLKGLNINPDAIAEATVKMKISQRNELANTKDKTGRLYSIGTNWNASVDYYATMLSNGVFEERELVGEQLLEGLVNGKEFEIDVTDYIKKAMSENTEELAFQFAVKDGGLIMKRKGDSETYAPLTITTIDSVPAEVTYTPVNGSSGVSINTGVTIDFGKNVDASTVTADNIKVTAANGDEADCKLSVDGSVAEITFNKPLEYETRYTVGISKRVKYSGDSQNYVFNSLSFVTEKKPFEFKGLVVKSEGKQIEKLSDRSGNTVSISAVVNNNSYPENKKVIVMTGLYKTTDTYCELVDIKTVSRTLTKGQSAVVNTDFYIPDEEGYSIICNVWDSLSDMNTLFTQRFE
ncbi:MAG: Ig-like domain-containing protein [Clostridia bacterium]|nr:Ig-like domain-containing protein [Clostridia bacterium]